MSIITNDIISAIEAAESPFNPLGYVSNIKGHESRIVLLQAELKDLTAFMSGELFSLSNNTIQNLIKDEISTIENRIENNKVEITVNFNWLKECIEWKESEYTPLPAVKRKYLKAS